MHRARKRMSRRELKQDPLLIWTSRVSVYLEENLWTLIGGVAAVVLVILASWIYRGWDARQHERAVSEMTTLLAIEQTGNTEEIILQADRVIASYGGLPEDVARLVKADALRTDGAYPAALQLYNDVRAEFDDNEVYSFRAAKGYADALAAQGDNSAASTALLEWADAYSESGLAAYALMNAAVNAESAGSYRAARDMLQRVVDDYSEAQIVGDARRRLKLMEGAVAATQ